ncbi:MAG: efflux RND transporter periplasmic adaptor subunit [Paracoccus sp. (in: a-proteobacteria)]
MSASPALAQDAPLPAVVVAPASKLQVSEVLTFNGRLDADQSIQLVARVPGFLEEVGFKAGDSVEQGALLFQIEPDQYRAAVRQAEGSLAAAESTVVDARIERDRQAELVQRDTVAQAALDTADAALGRAQGAVDQAEAALDTAKLNLSYTRITAPFAGRIGTRNVDPGALVSPEVGALAELNKLDPIHVDFSVPTAEYRNAVQAIEAGEVKADDAVRIILANGDEYDVTGVLNFVDSAVNPGTDSVRLRATFSNPEGLLLHDELVRVHLATSSADPVLTVPISAVQRDLAGDFVMVVNDQDEVEQRRISVMRNSGNVAVIGDGLAEGERVITEGVNKVRAGIKVDAAEADTGTQPQIMTEEKDG